MDYQLLIYQVKQFMAGSAKVAQNHQDATDLAPLAGIDCLRAEQQTLPLREGDHALFCAAL
jgi:hypothetical protein